jgi:2-polyprenyl-3-methyl-5-hydroxy-6-metoxy-1,4-benzoquinol methylase
MRGFRVNKIDYVYSQIDSRPRSILHVGCTDSPSTIWRLDTGTLLHEAICNRLSGDDVRVVGIDIDDEAISLLKARLPGLEILHADAHNLSATFGFGEFDLVIAGDVIEHVPNPGLFLNSCRGVLKSDGRLLLTTTNAFGVIRFLKSIAFHEAVHADHMAYYSPKTLKRLLEACGFIVVESGYYECEAVKGFLPNRLIGNSIERVLCRIWPQWSEGLVMLSAPNAL